MSDLSKCSVSERVAPKRNRLEDGELSSSSDEAASKRRRRDHHQRRPSPAPRRSSPRRRDEQRPRSTRPDESVQIL